MIYRDTVVTAGHCVYDKNQGGWAINLRVYPAKNGTGNIETSTSFEPYLSCKARALYTNSIWINSSDAEAANTGSANYDYDYGAIKLTCPVGDTTGWFAFKYSTTTLNGIPTTLAGYHGNLDNANTMWYTNDDIDGSFERYVLYKHDTWSATSGAPVYSTTDNYLLAIHSKPQAPFNRGTRINSEVFNFLEGVKNDFSYRLAAPAFSK